MTKTWSNILSEAAGAAVGSAIGVSAIGYGAYVLVTNSLNVVF